MMRHPDPTQTQKPLHIFRAGTYTDRHGQTVTLSAADVAALAAAYDPALHRAPIVVGHPKDNAPAFGWIAGLRASGEDLEGEPIQVDAAFAEAVRAGRYQTRSASLWPPNHPGNPKPGTWYLRHVGFLGGAAPAVKGLRGADLAEADDLTLIELTEDPTMPDTAPAADLAARQADLDTQAAALAAREQAVAEREAAAAAQAEAMRRTEIAAFCDSLASEARIRPADAPALVALLAELPDTAAMEFADADDGAKAPRPAGAWFRDFLGRLKPIVELGEVATKDRAGSAAVAEFAAPAGFAADPQGLALHRKAKVYQAEHPNTDYKAAVLAVIAGV